VAGNAIEPGRTVTSRLAAILRAFTEGSEHSLTELASLTGLPISTAHRLISELASARLLERAPSGLYHAGLPLRMISSSPDDTPILAERASYVLEDLAEVTHSRARLGVLKELEVCYLEKQPGHSPTIGFTPAATLPAHPTALGRALLAFSPQSVAEMTIMRGLRPYTSHTITAPDEFRRALAVIRLTRVAVTRFELEADVCAVAMPVFGTGGNLLAAIEVAVREGNTAHKAVLAPLTIAARSLSRELACHPSQGDDGRPQWRVQPGSLAGVGDRARVGAGDRQLP
jgi:DNA-binding IclR family transcriptional regulator